jgi:hypothetical protein
MRHPNDARWRMTVKTRSVMAARSFDPAKRWVRNQWRRYWSADWRVASNPEIISIEA